MKMLIAALLIAASALALVAAGADGDPTVEYDATDPLMNAAIIEARTTLPMVLGLIDAPQPDVSDVILKLMVPNTSEGMEHIWVEGVTRAPGGDLAGTYANDPNDFEGSYGDPVEFSADRVSDWGYWRDDRLHGHYTTRVILPRMSDTNAARLTAILAPLPTGAP